MTEEPLLYYAVRENRLDFMKLLLEKGAKIDVRAKCDDTLPLLHVALRNRSIEIVQLLLSHNVKLNVRKLSWFDQPREFIATLFDKRVFLRIFRTPEAIVDAQGYTLLHWACSEGKLKQVQAFLRYYPGLLNKKSRDGNTALHFAVTRDDCTEIIEFLLGSCGGIDTEVANSRGETALHRACLHGKSEKAVEAFSKFDVDFR